MEKVSQKGQAVINILLLLSATWLAWSIYTTLYKPPKAATANKASSAPFFQRNNYDSPPPSAQPSPSAQAAQTFKLTQYNSPLAIPQPSLAPIRAEPASIVVSKKRSELSYMPVFTIYYPGTHRLAVLPDDGRAGIFGSFLNSNKSFAEITDHAQIVVGVTNELKTGTNTVNLLIKPGTDEIAAMNTSEVILSIPITIVLTD